MRAEQHSRQRHLSKHPGTVVCIVTYVAVGLVPLHDSALRLRVSAGRYTPAWYRATARLVLKSQARVWGQYGLQKLRLGHVENKTLWAYKLPGWQYILDSWQPFVEPWCRHDLFCYGFATI